MATCPHCGLETKLFIPPTTNACKVQKSKPTQNKRLILAWIVAAIFILCTLCLTLILIAEHLPKRNGEDAKSSEKNSEHGQQKKNNILEFVMGTKNENRKPIQKLNFPPPPPNRVEFTTKLLENFPERVRDKEGWMDGEFFGIENSPVETYLGSSLAKEIVAFGVYDKNFDSFRLCYASKADFGDLLLKLNFRDQIRILGKAQNLYFGEKLWFHVESIQVIK